MHQVQSAEYNGRGDGRKPWPSCQQGTQYQPSKVGFFDKAYQHRKDEEEQGIVATREVVPILGYAIGISNQHKTWREQAQDGWRIPRNTISGDTPPSQT